MPRSDGQFKPGNPYRAKPGNRLAVRHGVYSVAAVEGRIPAKVEQLYGMMPWLVEADQEGVKSFASVCLHEDDLQAHMEATGGHLFTVRGKPRPVASLWKDIQHAKREWMKVLAMGPGPRSQYVQAMSSGRRDAAEVEARVARMRAKQAAAVRGDAS